MGNFYDIPKPQITSAMRKPKMRQYDLWQGGVYWRIRYPIYVCAAFVRYTEEFIYNPDKPYGQGGLNHATQNH